ncbi:hypothetical protein BDZ45DRAFT_435048 [Acephala macrosclerotiorum]|nr:hypothetical protein BDZ45DRAFT_435048 [Acephala macrosclerotiorum]
MSGPSKPSWVSQSQMDEIKAFNASLTSAGNRSRPGRSRAPSSGINRGGRSGFNPGRPTSTFAVPPPRTGSGVRTRPGTSWTVGPTVAQPQFKPASPRVRSRSPSRAASTPTMMGPYTVGPLPGTTASKPPSPPKIRNPVLVVDGPILAESRGTPTAVAPEPASHFQQQPPPQGRELITSNMTPDDPSKPWIPAHLQQKSAFGAIRHLSEITGLGKSMCFNSWVSSNPA